MGVWGIRGNPNPKSEIRSPNDARRHGCFSGCCPPEAFGVGSLQRQRCAVAWRTLSRTYSHPDKMRLKRKATRRADFQVGVIEIRIVEVPGVVTGQARR